MKKEMFICRQSIEDVKAGRRNTLVLKNKVLLSNVEYESHESVNIDFDTLTISPNQPFYTDAELDEMERIFYRNELLTAKLSASESVRDEEEAESELDVDHIVDLSFKD